jgi:hypothetical protein
MSMGGEMKEGTRMWLTPKQARLVTGLERYQLDWLRKTGKLLARKWGNMWVYHVEDLYRSNERAREVLDELADFCERTESGKHFTEAFHYWTVLEECGWLAVHRPVHPATGIQFSQEYWRAELTREGMEVANYIAELKVAGPLD